MTMEKFMTSLIYSCRKATELIDKKSFEKLSPLERVRLFMHTRLCDACRIYEKQTALIHKAMRRQSTPDLSSPSSPSSPDVPASPTNLSSFKEKVKENIKD